MKYFIGLLFIVVGIWMVMKTEWILQNVGSNAWAEANLGTNGGSRLLYKLIGMALIFIGFVVVTNMYEGFMMAIFGKLIVR
jgi:hypothetical protein